MNISDRIQHLRKNGGISAGIVIKRKHDEE